MPFTALYHTHKLVVLLFVLIYLIKAILLITGKKDILAKFTRIIKIPEMVVSALFFITGIVMLQKQADFTTLFAIKMILVVIAIPVAVMAYKRANKALAILAVFLLIIVYGVAEMNKAMMGKRKPIEQVIADANDPGYSLITHGQALYNAQCAVCHGEKGEANLSGAKSLKASRLDNVQITAIINKGKNAMPKMKGKYSDQEMDALVSYIKDLR